MPAFIRELFRRVLVVCVALISAVCSVSPLWADDCKAVPNILVLFDASGYMKEKEHYSFLLKQMDFFEKAIPITADGFFNVGLRHYGLKVGMGCENTESIMAIQPWDPQKFMNSFPKSVSYGVSSLSAGLRAASDEVASISGKTVIVVIGGGLESCKVDPVKITQQICFNNPEIEIHTFQIGNAMEGTFFLKGIAQHGRGTYHNADLINSPAEWHAWMKRYLTAPCPGRQAAPSSAPSAPAVSPITFDQNSAALKSKDPSTEARNLASLDSLAKIIVQSPGTRVIMHSYADAKGKPETNLKLARQRAEAVSAYLSRTYGISANQLGIVVHRPGQAPAYQTGVESDRSGRRVEFEILK